MRNHEDGLDSMEMIASRRQKTWSEGCSESVVAERPRGLG